MPPIRITASEVLEAPSAAVYAVLADYREGHPEILPQPYFSNLEIERGGTGAGTIIRFDVRAGREVRRVRAEITEPEPGRVLVETDLATGAVTKFVVDPESDGAHARVTISTEWNARGLRGWVERLLAPTILERVYAEELRNLEAVARQAAED